LTSKQGRTKIHCQRCLTRFSDIGSVNTRQFPATRTRRMRTCSLGGRFLFRSTQMPVVNCHHQHATHRVRVEYDASRCRDEDRRLQARMISPGPALRSSPPESRSMPCTVRTTPVPAARAVAPWALWLATHRDGSCPAGCSATARDGLAGRARALNLTQRLQSCYSFSKKKKMQSCCTLASSSTALCRVAPYPGDLDSDSASARVRAGRAGPRARGAATTGSAGTTGSQGERTCRRSGGRGPGSPRPVARCLSAPACRVRA
jgi:hypothetical protein